jgi:hypothetical protein
MPVLLDLNFVVDSTNGNGLGIRNLKGPYIQNVFMHTTATPGQGNSNPQSPNIPVFSSNPAGPVVTPPPPGPTAPNLASFANFAILGASAVTGSTGAGSVVNGDLGIYPAAGTFITNFPPSIVNGTIHATDTAAHQGQIDAQAAFTAGQTAGLGGTVIPAELGGTTLTPGTYQSTTSLGLSLTTGHSTLTLNGPGVYLFYSPSTLTTGASGSTDLPTFAFTGGATPSNTFLYWIVGSSATINQAVASAGATFYGTVIAQASVTTTQAGTVVGRLAALTAAITLTGTDTINLPASPPPPGTVGGGTIVVQLQDNFSELLKGFKAIVSPLSGTPVAVSALSLGIAYTIVSVGTTTQAQWTSIGVPIGVTPAVGVSFIATATSTSGSGMVETTSALGSGITTIETVGDPQLSISPQRNIPGTGIGSQFIFQCRNYLGANAAPADGTVISLGLLLSNSSVKTLGE